MSPFRFLGLFIDNPIGIRARLYAGNINIFLPKVYSFEIIITIAWDRVVGFDKLLYYMITPEIEGSDE